MPLPTDPETLKIPAFMRKRNLSSRQRRPLILTALDRKRAGLPPEGLKKKEKAVRKKVERAVTRRASAQELPFFSATRFKVAKEKKITRRKTAPHKRKTKLEGELRLPKSEFFTPPMVAPLKRGINCLASPRLGLIDAPEVQTQKPVGRITHYYDKIKVGVIEITGAISVGDCISYETQDGGTYEQIIESMEINRQPVFNAKKGDDIGIKLRKTPKIESKVYAA